MLKEFHTRWDFSKDTALRDKHGKLVPGAGSLTAMEVPEEGTPVEIAAMNEHAIRTRPTTEPNGEPGNFILNGLPPTNGAPFADPGVNDQGDANIHRRRYQAAVFQVDTILNKKGWHYPQQRMISLWQDVAPTVDKTRAPEPFFFRTNTSDSIQFWHTNLLPSYYELDDFQVRTPTDIVGQHIHLVKFDVTASDGAGNGFNYEDGTFAPDEVQERIDSINARGGLFAFDPATGFVNLAKQEKLTLKNVGDYYPPPESKFVRVRPEWRAQVDKAGRKAWLSVCTDKPCRGVGWRPDDDPVMGGGFIAQQRRSGSDAAHGVQPRPLQPLDASTGGPLRRHGRRAGEFRVASAAWRADEYALGWRPDQLAGVYRDGKPGWTAIASSCSNSRTCNSPTQRAARPKPPPSSSIPASLSPSHHRRPSRSGRSTAQ